MRKGRILIVDDSPAIRSQVASALFHSGEHEVVGECADGFSALKAIVDCKPDVVLCDLHMPHCDGTQLLRMKAARPEVGDIPVIMLTSANDLASKVALLEQGAADYVTKPFAPRELLARVRIHLRLRTMQEELKAANQRLADLACTDGLLGIYNRRHLDRVLDQEVARHLRYGVPFGLVLLDVDHFKRVNDVHGHAIGDSVLSAIAATLKGLVRQADTVARYGGEEICVVLASTGRAGSMILAERLRTAVEQIAHRDAKGALLRVTASFGATIVEREEPGLTAAAVLARADVALYAAKAGGRNRVVVWNEQGQIGAKVDRHVA